MKFWNGLALGAMVVGSSLFAAPEVKDLAGKQIELCMIGDSITWAGNGDHFRKNLIEKMPELAFVGSHTAMFGYSHAGEGGNNTSRVLERINKKLRVPDARYYHLLIGVNDNAACKNAEAAPAQARKTYTAITRIVDALLARSTTEKIFVGTLLPCGNDSDPTSMSQQFRDLGNVETSKLLRAELLKKYPDGRVALVEYENVLRPREDWRKIIRLHPTPEGYVHVAAVLADALKKGTTPPKAAFAAGAKPGVEVTNLWSAKNQCTAPLIPGWYTVSFDVTKVTGDTLKLQVESRFPKSLKTPFAKEFSVKAEAGKRAEFTFMTGYQGYGYDEGPLVIKPLNGEINQVLVEKMRPSKRASVYGTGTYVDTVSPMALGEKLVPATK